MLPTSESAQIAKVCRAIGNEVADEHGFVAVRNLLSRFRARLLIRPLLVEAMLASLESEDSGTTRWAVLVDSETSGATEDDIIRECREMPLPSRLRNTVAHELVHSLAFRPSEFGITLSVRRSGKEGRTSFVRAIEDETEQFSPLLLLPDRVLSNLFSARETPLTVEELSRLAREMGVSRYVLINRLRLLQIADTQGILYSSSLRNIAIGIAEWADDGSAVLRKWPLFVSFERNIWPSFLIKLLREDRLAARTLFDDQSFVMCGGRKNSSEFVTGAGSQAFPDAEQMTIQCFVEHSKRTSGTAFLYVVQRQDAGHT